MNDDGDDRPWQTVIVDDDDDDCNIIRHLIFFFSSSENNIFAYQLGGSRILQSPYFAQRGEGASTTTRASVCTRFCLMNGGGGTRHITFYTRAGEFGLAGGRWLKTLTSVVVLRTFNLLVADVKGIRARWFGYTNH